MTTANFTRLKSVITEQNCEMKEEKNDKIGPEDMLKLSSVILQSVDLLWKLQSPKHGILRTKYNEIWYLTCMTI